MGFNDKPNTESTESGRVKWQWGKDAQGNEKLQIYISKNGDNISGQPKSNYEHYEATKPAGGTVSDVKVDTKRTS